MKPTHDGNVNASPSILHQIGSGKRHIGNATGTVMKDPSDTSVNFISSVLPKNIDFDSNTVITVTKCFVILNPSKPYLIVGENIMSKIGYHKV